MTIPDFLNVIENKRPPAPPLPLADFERSIGQAFPEDYRQFLIGSNGGSCGGMICFEGPTPEGKPADAGVHHIGGFRKENYFSLPWSRNCFEGRIPHDLVWIMDDPCGNAICLGVKGAHRGHVFFWDHENEPDEDWDGEVETAGNLQLLAHSFTDFVAGLKRMEPQ